MASNRRRVRVLVAGILPVIEIAILLLTGVGILFFAGLIALSGGEAWLAWDEVEGPIPAQFSLPIRPLLATEYLGLMIRGWFRFRTSHYRANVMLWNPDSQILEVWAAYGMDSASVEEMSLTLVSGQGCAGQAFAHKRVVYVDLNVHKHEDFGVRREQIWPSMQSILSVPILHGETIIGVLSVDSDLPLAESGFKDAALYEDVSKYATMIFGNADEAA